MITTPLPAAAPVGMYIHIPFCTHICPYCDFATYAGKEALVGRYVTCVEAELASAAVRVEGRVVSTVFLGGGTPSLLEPAQVRAIIDACRTHYDMLPGAEVTMECNPNGLTVERLAGYRAAGVNRLSIGAQTLDRRGLRTLGRHHEASDVTAAVANARTAGFDNLSLDFIFGWPGQTLTQWQADLERVLAMPGAPDHLSLYSLIVEPGTPYADAAARGILLMPDDDATADMYELAMSTLAAVGWRHYEVANWSREADRYSRHNAIYWQHGDYLGIGAGAHGTIGSRRTMNHLLPETYCLAVERGEATASNMETIDRRTQMAETMLLGLRLLDAGVDAAAFQARHGVPLHEVYGARIDDLARIGLIERTGSGVRLTQRGLLLANEVIAHFL